MSEDDDRYWKLRPPPPTPSTELCSCEGTMPIMLQPHFSPNPLSCLACSLEVPPERLGFSSALAERIAFWRDFHDCFYRLWLDSAEFETWAKAQLEDPNSEVNTRALELVHELRGVRRAYYWWFQDVGAEDFQPTTACLRCEAHLEEKEGRLVCELCAIVISN